MRVYVLKTSDDVAIIFKSILILMSHLERLPGGDYTLKVCEMDEEEYEHLYARTTYAQLVQNVAEN